MTEAMPFLQKAILLSYDPRPLGAGMLSRWRGYREGETDILILVFRPIPVVPDRLDIVVVLQRVEQLFHF